jgi:hypothetical protein
MTLSVALLLGLGASCAKVEADIPDTQVTQKAVPFQGIPGAALAGEVSTTQTVTLSADSLSWIKDLNSEVYAHEVEIRAVSGVQDLGFIDLALVTMSTGDPSVAPIEVVDYQRPDNYTAGPVLDVKTVSPIDVTSVWTAQGVVLTMQIAGNLPEQAWAADITLFLSGKVSYSF